MKNFKIVTFKNEETTIDVRVDEDSRTAYLGKSEIAKLFDKDRTTILRQISSIIKEIVSQNAEENNTHNDENLHTLAQVFAHPCTGFAHPLVLEISPNFPVYNLDIVLKIGERIKSSKGLILYEFINNYFYKDSKENCDIIIYDNGTIHVEVEIVPDENSAWMSANEISQLYGTSLRNIYLHIQNIINEGEIEVPVVKENFTTESHPKYDMNNNQNIDIKIPSIKKSAMFYKDIQRVATDGKQYVTRLYNLDMILAVGYRVKSTTAIQFRRWVSSKLKDIMFKGYTIEEKTCIECKNDILDLKREILQIKESSNKIIKYNPGDELRGFIEIKRFLETAKKRILIIDNYLGHMFDDILSNLKVSKIIVTHPNNAKIESNDNYKVIKSDYYHDRYIFVDNVCYHSGMSFEHLGKHQSSATRQNDFTYEEALAKVMEQK